MIIKLVFSIIIIFSGVMAGKLLSKPYENRIDHLQSMHIALSLLESEMKYRLDPLGEVFAKIGKESEGYVSTLFKKASVMLESYDLENFNEAWNRLVTEVFSNSSLTKKDLTIIGEIGLELGRTDISGQGSIFQRIYIKLDDQIREASDINSGKGKMFTSLGTAAGILIVIILI